MKKTVIPLYMILTLLLGVRHGQLALINNDTGSVCRTYPLPVCMLPPSDQQKLVSGIEITDALQLAQLLEDYLS